MRAALIAVIFSVAVAGCSRSYRTDKTPDPTPTCTPIPAYSVHVELASTNAMAAAGRMASFRVLNGGAPYFCSSALVPASGVLQFLSPDVNGPGDLTAELVLNSGAEAVFGSGDQHYSLPVPAEVQTDYCAQQYLSTIHFDAVLSTESAITWQLGAACPGT